MSTQVISTTAIETTVPAEAAQTESVVNTSMTARTVYGIDESIVEEQIPIQLHSCWQQELNKGKGGFVITPEDLDKNGERNWAQISLSFPELAVDGEIRIRVGLNIIQGERRKVKIEAGTVNSFVANVPDPALRGSKANNQIRIRSNYMLLRDLLAVTDFDIAEQNRIVGWARNYINGVNSLANLSLVPKTDDAVFAFDVKLNYHPDTRLLSVKTPVGINNFFLSGFGLLPNSALSTFGGNFKIKGSSKIVSTKLDSPILDETIEAEVTDEDI